ncbi:MAG: CAP domain-containing protein [Pseudonocardiaceae bacterium]
MTTTPIGDHAVVLVASMGGWATRRSWPRYRSLSKAMTGPAKVTKRTRKYLLALIIPVLVASSQTTNAAQSVTTLSTESSASARQALALVNQQRAESGCASLWVIAKLQTPADRQSRDQAAGDRLGHNGANGSTVNGRLSRLGYSRWAENVAQFQSAQAAVHFWSTSPGHRATMRNCAFRETGLAVARSSSGKFYWTQTFGG